MALTDTTIKEYLERYQVEWADNLPDNCPPENILVPEDHEVFRFTIEENDIVDDDWKTYADLYPEAIYVKKDPIHASGLSVDTNPEMSIKKLPIPRNFKGIMKIKLNPKDGVLEKSGKRATHYTWWRTKLFDKSQAEIIKPDET